MMHVHLGEKLSNLCSNAKHLFLAAPYIKVDALKEILANVGSCCSVICVTRWNPQDLVLGVSDTECRTIINALGGSFRLHPSLHAKYYRADDAVLIGSANLTSPALGWSDHSNLEILCQPGDDFDWLEFEKKMLDDARDISDDEFKRWQATSLLDVQHHYFTVNQPPIDLWRPATRDPRNLERAYAGEEGDIASFDEQQAARRDIETLALPTGLSSKQVKEWASVSLLAAPFTTAVLQLHARKTPRPAHVLADTFGLNITNARRDMETVENWIAYFLPEKSW